MVILSPPLFFSRTATHTEDTADVPLELLYLAAQLVSFVQPGQAGELPAMFSVSISARLGNAGPMASASSTELYRCTPSWVWNDSLFLVDADFL